jgi:hypothetical protein
MKYIKCPENYVKESEYEKVLFLGGGITNVADWQEEMAKLLAGTNLTLLNPRRDFYDNNNPELAKEQIKWEYDHLRHSNGIIFWFASETLCPITLFEYGYHLGYGLRDLFLGIHPEYKRKLDLEIQTALVNAEFEDLKNTSFRTTSISYSLVDLASQVINWAENT